MHIFAVFRARSTALVCIFAVCRARSTALVCIFAVPGPVPPQLWAYLRPRRGGGRGRCVAWLGADAEALLAGVDGHPRRSEESDERHARLGGQVDGQTGRR